jgi:hypothetical protein
MRNITERLHGSDRKDGRPLLTARQFLGKDEGLSYFKPDRFIAYAKSLKPREINNLRVIFEGMSEGLSIVGDLSSREDKGGRSYKYPEFRSANAQSGAKLIMEDGMIPFLKDYMNAKFIVGFTVDELVEEALNE